MSPKNRIPTLFANHHGSILAVAFVVAALFANAPVALATGSTPSCPFSAQAGRTVVTFSPSGLIASVGPTERSQRVSLPAGRYRVWYYSYDGYPGRSSTPPSEQDREQWKLILKAADGTTLAELGPTPDLEDGVEFTEAKGKLADEVVVARPVAQVIARHLLHPASSTNPPNSVHAGCVAFDRLTTAPPACPYGAEDGTVVRFAPVWLRSDLGEDRAKTAPVAVSLPAGTYRVKAFSFDNHSDKPGHQPNEQWFLKLLAGASVVAQTPPTPDIPDNANTVEATWTITLSQAVDAVVAYHAAYPYPSSPNSVVPICAAFKKLLKPSCTLSANPSSITQGESATLSWTSENATSATLVGVGAADLSGERNVTPSTTTTYVLEVAGAGGTARCEATVTVVPPAAPTCELSASPSFVDPNATTTLSWSTRRAASVTLEPGVGSVDAEGSRVVTVATTTTYRLVARDHLGREAVCTATVQVRPPQAPVCSMSITPDRVVAGQGTEVTLRWESANVTSAEITPDLGSVAPSGSFSFTPNESREYVGRFTGPGGTVECRARVEVVPPPVCTSCGGGFDQPRVTLAAQPLVEPPAQEPLGYVYLTQIPYTGIKMSPLAALMVWTGLFGVSVAIAYWLVMRGGFARLAQWFGFAAPSPGPLSREPEPTAAHPQPAPAPSEPSAPAASAGEGVDGATAASAAPAEPVTSSALATAPVSASVVVASSAPEVANNDGGEEALLRELEEMAHAKHIIISPEGLREIVKRAEGNAAAARALLKEMLAAAERLYEREDGWIPLNRDRVRALLLATWEAKSAPVDSAPEEGEEEAPAATASLSEVVEQTVAWETNTQETPEGEEDTAKSASEHQEEEEKRETPSDPRKELVELIRQATLAQEVVPFARESELIRAIAERDEERALRVLQAAQDPRKLVVSAGEALDRVISARKEGKPTPKDLGAVANAAHALSQEEQVAIVEALLAALDKPYAPEVAAKLAVLSAIHRA